MKIFKENKYSRDFLFILFVENLKESRVIDTGVRI